MGKKIEELYEEAITCLDKAINYADRAVFLLKLAKTRAAEEIAKAREDTD